MPISGFIKRTDMFLGHSSRSFGTVIEKQIKKTDEIPFIQT